MASKQTNKQPAVFLKNPAINIPLALAALLLLVAGVLAVIQDRVVGMIVVLLFLIAGFLVFWVLSQVEDRLESELMAMMNTIQTVQNEVLLQMPIGIILFSEDDTIAWMNPYLHYYIDQQDVIGQTLEEIDERLATEFDHLLAEEEHVTHRVEWNERFFDVGLLHEKKAMYFLDITEYGKIAKEASDNRLVIGYVLVDNYDEIMAALNDRRKSTIDNYITKQLTSWGRKHRTFLKALDDDRFLMVGSYASLKTMEDEKFEVINTIREATSKGNFPLTVSIGISYHEDERILAINKIADEAQANLDLALSRGGDQVVIKTKDHKVRYYGGKTNPMVKRTHVRSRQIANTIGTMMAENHTVFVMGHDYPDMDAIGSCVGIRRIAQMNDCQCYIVVDEEHVNEDIKRVLEQLHEDEDNAGSLISPKEASELIQPDSLLFLVDVHRPSLTVAPSLIETVNGVVVIDHHRKGEEVPDNILLEYIEPYASSASELITEFFEYQNAEAKPVNRLEATIMLAGITVDSRSFSLRTGSRTFDAASYLKSNGADSVLIQEFLKEDLADYMTRSQLIESVDLVKGHYGVAEGPADQAVSTVIAAQAADSLLSMNKVQASFVVFLREDGRVGISARSLGNINVQVIMEALGGGGHLSNAATQLADVSVHEAVEQLVSVLNEHEEAE